MEDSTDVRTLWTCSCSLLGKSEQQPMLDRIKNVTIEFYDKHQLVAWCLVQGSGSTIDLMI